MKRSVMIGFTIGIITGSVLAGGVVYAQSALSGQRFLNLTETLRGFYAIGFAQGFIAGAVVGSDDPDEGDQLATCVDRQTYGQTLAIIEQYIRNHPESWHEEVGLLALKAVHGACSGTTE